MSDKQILVIDIGGISVKMALSSELATPETLRRFPTPASMTPAQLVEGVQHMTRDWQYDAVSIGYPGPVKNNRVWREPVNLGSGWVDYDFQAALGCPVKLINDAAMQALGSYRGGDMLFLGLGTGLGTALIQAGQIIPMEVAHLPFRDGRNFELVLGQQGLDESGKQAWFADLMAAIDLLSYAFCSDYVVLGGGNSRLIEEKQLPDDIYLGDNSNVFTGGCLLWEEQSSDQDVLLRYAI